MNDCCEDIENRGQVEQLSEDLSLTRCRVCGAAHYEVVVDMADLSTEVESL